MSAETQMNVLLVEDSSAMRTYVSSIVESAGDYQITEANSGFEALKLLPRGSFDLIITDINMPDINGFELINFIKKIPRYRDTPLFIITTEGREKDREKGMALGANEYLVKPFSPEKLHELLKHYLMSRD